ncbi:MAG: hypothetical protein M3Y55_14915 [Pseudomonadota bacterium]|nr:hypothetical protein [Pseudomonadota bacterium]
MIWVKTDAGRAEVQLRAHLKDRALRALLVLIDGKKSEEEVLRSLPDGTAEDFQKLRDLGLVAPWPATPLPSSAIAVTNSNPGTRRPTLAPADFEELAVQVKRLISAHLGLGGLALTLALERARTMEELALVARRILEQIQARQGTEAAAIAREALRRLIADE